MAEANERMTMPMKAVANLTACRYHIVRTTGERTINIASHSGAAGNLAAIGILNNAPNSGQNGTVVYAGIEKVVAGGSIGVNLWITNNGSGRATAAASGDVVVGRALQAASADGDVITCQVGIFRIGPIS